jgi:hypothetical protein
VAVIGLLAVRRLRATRSGSGSGLVELSVVEQRYRAVLAVLAGEAVVEVDGQGVGCRARPCTGGWPGIETRPWAGWWIGRIAPSSVPSGPGRGQGDGASCAVSARAGVRGAWRMCSGGRGLSAHRI